MAADEVLIIASSMIGDTILSSGAIAAIFERHPDARHTIVSSPGAAILFRRAPAEATVVVLTKQKHGRHWMALWRALRGRRWSAIYDFRDSVVSRLLNGPRHTPRRSGEPTHKVVEASTILVAGPATATATPPRLWLTWEHASRLPPALRAAHRILAIGPGATRLGKTWPAERFGELASRLTGPGGAIEGALIVPVGGSMDTEAAGVIARSAASGQVVDLTGADLLTTGALLARSTLFVGNDSGMMHLAAAAGCPTLGLFGPTDERLYGPWGTRTAVVRPEGVAFTFGKTSRTVSTTESQMLGLDVAAVVEAAEGLLGPAVA